MRLRNVVNTSVDEKYRGAPLLRAVKTCRRKTIGKIISSTRAGVAMQLVNQSSTIGADVVSV